MMPGKSADTCDRGACKCLILLADNFSGSVRGQTAVHCPRRLRETYAIDASISTWRGGHFVRTTYQTVRTDTPPSLEGVSGCPSAERKKKRRRPAACRVGVDECGKRRAARAWDARKWGYSGTVKQWASILLASMTYSGAVSIKHIDTRMFSW